MPPELHCPNCSSANVIFSKKRRAYACEDCGQVLPEAPVSSLRIFLSYGHDEHISLAIHLRDDLRNRGHTVWFDEERLQPGHDWEAFIGKGPDALPNSGQENPLVPRIGRLFRARNRAECMIGALVSKFFAGTILTV